MILPKERDPRLVTISRGGMLTEEDHHLLALWSAECAERVLPIFESAAPGDPRPREAIAGLRRWIAGELPMMQTRALGGHAMGAARPLVGAGRFAAYAAGQAACVAHVPEHDLGAAAYAIRAVEAGAAQEDREAVRAAECAWQRSRLPQHLLELVTSDQQCRNPICWNVFTV
ncbi:putative immunity protein [Dermacoccaceae bacterium W4C1]